MNTIRTNVDASLSTNMLRMHNMQSVASMNRLATGQKFSPNNLNSSSYVASGATTSDVRSLEMGAKNINQAIALVQSIDATAAQIQNQLMDIKDFYGNPNAPDLPILNASAGTDTHAYGDAALYTRFHGSEGGWHTDNMSVSQHSLIQMDRAIDGITRERARIGAYITRLNQASEASLDSVVAAKSQHSQVTDTNYAKEVTELSKSQILAQTATAILTQASKNKDSLLALLQ